MTVYVDIQEAKTHLPCLLEQVAAGVRVVISKAGIPVADLVPHQAAPVTFGGMKDEIERTRLTMMRHYAEHDGCRRSFLLSYFGQDYPGPCGNCDNDRENPEEAQAPPTDVPFAVGARVLSEKWGEGTVQRYDGDQVTVLFDEHGYRELFVPVVLERARLRPA